MSNSMSKHTRLATTRTRQNQKRTFSAHNSVILGGIQRGKVDGHIMPFFFLTNTSNGDENAPLKKGSILLFKMLFSTKHCWAAQSFCKSSVYAS
jgi:hypothetical protein